ncbi:MAG: capsule biosynthesis protein CapA [Alphaproteobacteria bacterium]|nr:MAG: capsule biosynthesis protein CapA [Alphaproteobacteria bacterium]
MIGQAGMTDSTRRFLFLQGPHGPFYDELAGSLRRAGATCWRIGVNRGDQAEWSDRASYIALAAPARDWEAALAGHVAALGITDLVIYGEGRPLHRIGQRLARAQGLNLHCFEEGYLRPWWLTYERGGLNGRSPLKSIGLDRIRRAVAGRDTELAGAPDGWGQALAHAWHGMRYHGWILALNRGYPHYRTHRDPGVAREVWLNARFLLGQPLRMLASRLRIRRLLRRATPYHLVLLQLGHDSAMLSNSRYRSVSAFMRDCMEAFARGAPHDHLLVFKTHPFEDMREPLPRIMRQLAARHGLQERVMMIHGGKLGRLLDHAQSAVTINSTAGQQALWRGLPLAALGDGVYVLPGLVSDQPLDAFFAAPKPPDLDAYRDFRRFLLATSQIRGGFYTARGRAAALPVLVERMLEQTDACTRLLDEAESAPAMEPDNVNRAA